MRWIERNRNITRRIAPPSRRFAPLALGIITLAGCASQDSLIPSTETKMVDIYRGAMNAVEGGAVDTLQPAAICAALELDEKPEHCQEKVGELVAREYRRLDETAPPEAVDYLPYTRTVDNELENLFPRLANPDLVIYVYPHLATRTRAPIPGYTTVLPLYERVEYRLPGESLRVTPTRADARKAIADENAPATGTVVGAVAAPVAEARP
ncbi:MAG: TIGR03751 family conjugal transfer lipoprotein [Parahaliea sp.]